MRKELKEEAVSIGLCDRIFKRLDGDRKALIKYYKLDPNWSLEHKFPSLEYLESNFNDDETRSMGVYISQHLDNLICDKQVYIFNNCTGSIHVVFNEDDAIFPMIYLGHGSNLDIIIDRAKTPVSLFDTSSANIDVINNGHVKVNNYGENNKVYIK